VGAGVEVGAGVFEEQPAVIKMKNMENSWYGLEYRIS